MKSRERVELALNHERPARCPLQVGFTSEFAARLQENMGLERLKAHNLHGGGNTYAIERPWGRHADYIHGLGQFLLHGCQTLH
jgi:hypothetical protein